MQLVGRELKSKKESAELLRQISDSGGAGRGNQRGTIACNKLTFPVAIS